MEMSAKKHLQSITNNIQAVLNQKHGYNEKSFKEELLLLRINSPEIISLKLFDTKGEKLYQLGNIKLNEHLIEDLTFNHKDPHIQKVIQSEVPSYLYSGHHEHHIISYVPIHFKMDPLSSVEKNGLLLLLYDYENEFNLYRNNLQNSAFVFFTLLTFFFIILAIFFKYSIINTIQTIKNTITKKDIKPVALFLKKSPLAYKELCELSDTYNTLTQTLQEEVKLRSDLAAELIEQQKLLLQTQSIAKIGAWEYNLDNNDFNVTNEFLSILECDKSEISFKRFISLIDRNNREFFLRFIKEKFSMNSTRVISLLLTTPKGNQKFIVISGEVFDTSNEHNKHSIVGFIQDVTQLWEKDYELKRFRLAVESNSLMILITDKNSNIEYLNPAFTKQTGYSLKEVKGKNPRIFSAKQMPPDFYKEMWEKLNNKEMWSGLVINRRKNGLIYDTRLTISPLVDDEGEVISYIAIEDDITEDLEKNRLIVSQTRQAQMGELLSMIAHQWRQPLNSISTVINNIKTDILLDQLSTNQLNDELTGITEQIQFLSTTLTDFRDFFNPNKSKNDTNIQKIIIKTLQIIDPILQKAQLKLDLDFQDTPILHTYEGELMQVFLNLFKNTLDVFEERKVKDPEISIKSYRNINDLVITFKDNAGGIEVESIDDIFIPYFSTKDEKNGTGLGLYMSKTIVEDHCHGRITASNAQGGALFTIELPLK